MCSYRKIQVSQATYTVDVLLIAVIITMATMTSFNSVTSGWLCHFLFIDEETDSQILSPTFLLLIWIPFSWRSWPHTAALSNTRAHFCLRMCALADFLAWKILPSDFTWPITSHYLGFNWNAPCLEGSSLTTLLTSWHVIPWHWPAVLLAVDHETQWPRVWARH